MITPALRAKKYGELSHEEYALWYASQIGVTEGDIVVAGKMRSLGLIEDAVTALLPTVDEQDIALTHDLVECMFHLLDLNSLEQLQDIITNQFEEYTR